MNTQHQNELDAIKRDVDFTAIAESFGYLLRGDKSSRKDKVMEGPDGSKIVVSRAANGHWIYFSTADPSNKGTVIDFVQRHNNCSLGIVRKLLRPYLSGNSTSYPQAMERVEKDFSSAAWAGLQVKTSQYLIERGITAQTQSDPLFQGRVRIDQRGNACFPLCAQAGLTGIARYNKAWKGIDEGSKRGIWTSNLLPFPVAQVQVVVTESPIDSLSFQQIQRGGSYYHIAICGSLSYPQIELIKYCIEVIGAKVVLSAFDADDAGDRYHADLVGAGIDTERIVPPADCKDWNEFLSLMPVKNI